MADVSNLHRAVSNRGQWRESFAIVASAAPDPSVTVFGVQTWPVDGRLGPSDYGLRAQDGRPASLGAATNDGSGRLSAAVVGTSLVLTWLFSSAEMRRLCAGSYEMGVLAGVADEMAEIHRIRFVVQDRGGAPAPYPAPNPSVPIPDPGNAGFAIDVREF